MSHEVNETAPLALGIVFQAYAADEEEANQILHQVIASLTMEWGFRDVQGGISPYGPDEEPCECEGPEDCDQGSGCWFKA